MANSWGNSWSISWGDSWGSGTPAGQTVLFMLGIGSAGITRHQSIAQPTIQLQDAGGGTYTVDKTHGVSGNFNPASINKESYLIDGELP